VTLGRQLLSGTALIFIALLVGIEAIYVASARGNLENQLDAHANETATQLALSIGARMPVIDLSLINIMVSPVFDRGHFLSITVEDPKGEILFARRLDRRTTDVPAWFTGLVTLEGPQGEALITSGWRQLGRVLVRVHPEYAYRQLYDAAIATLAWLVLLFALALVAMRLYLLGILRPLKKIEETADAISNRRFVTVDIRPRTRELQSVIAAINSLSGKIRDTIASETSRAERLRHELYEDGMTGQLNRRGLERSIESAIGENGDVHSGTLALFAPSGLEDINKALGVAKGDALLAGLAAAMAAPAPPILPLVGRWHGPVFAAFLSDVSDGGAREWAQSICASFPAQMRSCGFPFDFALSCGLAGFGGGARLAEFAQRAEAALARVAGKGGVALDESRADAPVVDTIRAVRQAIDAGRVSLLCQKVLSVEGGHPLQMEFMSQIADAGSAPIAAGTFVPIAAQLGLLPLLDRKVAEMVVAAVTRDSTLPRTISLNVSLQSVGDASFRAWLIQFLKDNPAAARRLVFEMTGAAASKSLPLTHQFAAELRDAGSRLALDHFELDRGAIATVHDLMPAYLKLAPAFTNEICARKDVRFVLEAMLRMLRPLEIPIIAQGVEDIALVPVLKELDILGYQGYAGGRPEPLPTF